jgi:hypothetical protein
MLTHPAFLADVPRHKKRPKRAVDEKYLQWVRENLPCVVTLRPNPDPHHLLLRPDRKRGTGYKGVDDDWILPLDNAIHRALHDDGNEERFLGELGIVEYVTLSALIRTAYEMDDPSRAMMAIVEHRRWAA